MANVFATRIRRGEMGLPAARAALKSVDATIDVWHTTEEVLDHALELAARYSHPIYGMIYIAVAQRLGFDLVTADTRLLTKFRGAMGCPAIRHIAEFA